MWINQLGSSQTDESFEVTLDSNENVFIAGTTTGIIGESNAGNSDTWVAKYDGQGNLLWTEQLGTPDLDRFEGIATDSNDNLYLSGSTTRPIPGSFTDFEINAFLAKYDSQGDLLWNQQLGFSGAESTGVATDSNGDIYISGSIQGNPGNGAFLAKYDSQGTLLWNQQLGTSGSEVSAGLTTDINNNIYLSGVTDGEDGDASITKYDSQGNLLWTRQLGTSEYDYSQDVATDNSGNIYISGGTNGSLDGSNAGVNDAWVAKYDSEGNLLWNRQIGTSSADSSEGVATDSDGNVYLSGSTQGTLGEANLGGNDAWVAKYDSEGNLLWTEQLGSSEDDDSQGVAVGDNGNVYLTGSTRGDLDGVNLGNSDAWVAQIDQSSINSNNGDEGTDSLLNTPINRFQNGSLLGTYLFAGAEESQNIRSNFPNFIEEGPAFKVATEPEDGLIRLNRFQNSNVPGTYLYAGEGESQDIRENFPNFIEEGIAFYVYPGSADVGVDFYRFQNQDVPGTYIFVGSEERQDILNNFPNFVEEGIAFEVEI